MCCQPAYAFKITGTYIKVEDNLDGPPSVCEVIVSKKGAMCSGTLIDQQYIATAAHCVVKHLYNFVATKEAPEERKMDEMKVYCGYHYNNAKEFYEEFNVTKVKYPKEVLACFSSYDAPEYDIAILKLDKRSQIKPMNVIGSWNEFVRIFRKNLFKRADYGDVWDNGTEVISNGKLNCRVSGYGDDNSGVSGALLTAEMRSPYTASDERLLLNPPAEIAEGDSGGPLYCQKPGNNAWNLIGVLHKADSYSFAGSKIFQTLLKQIQDEK
jgi:hypothetical protein